MEKINTEIIKIDPKELKLLDLNARYMRHETFQQLVENIRRDGSLTQLPFAIWEDDTQRYKVLSGNHRVQAAIEAGLTEIPCLVTHDDLSEDRQVGIQLSHNAISGEDDPTILKSLYEGIADIDMKTYAGLDDKTLELLENVQPESIGEANLEFQVMNIVFLPHELEKIKNRFKEIESEIAADNVWLARNKQYDDFLDYMEATSESYDVKNVATTFQIMLEVLKKHWDELSDGWDDKESDETKHNNWVPISTVINNHKIPASSAKVLQKAVDKMMSQGDITKHNKWQALEYLAADYMGGK